MVFDKLEVAEFPVSYEQLAVFMGSSSISGLVMSSRLEACVGVLSLSSPA